MSGPPRVRSMNHTNPEPRSILGPAGNKSRSPLEPRKLKKPAEEVAELVKSPVVAVKKSAEVRVVLMRSNLSMDASCSSDASSDSSPKSRASTGRVSRSGGTIMKKGMQCGSRIVRSDEKIGGGGGGAGGKLSDDSKRCAWVTSTTDPAYVDFHDEEWGVPVHDDRKLFELLSLCTALAELSWPVILNKRKLFREVFQDFDPVAVSKLNDKKITTAGSSASSLLSEVKLRAIIENARQTCKIADELGSFDKYIWGFVNYKPMVGHFRYPRQVPIKTSKADAISKDLIRRGFRGVGPTVIYSFMQVCGITNDHLIGCFRFQYCLAPTPAGPIDNKDALQTKTNGKQPEDAARLGLTEAMDDLSLCT